MSLRKDKHFYFGETEINCLKSKCVILGKAINKIGKVERPVTTDLFSALIHSIVGQQISNKAVATIWGRIELIVSPITPVSITATPLEDLQKCGISFRKASYIKEIAATIVNGNFNKIYGENNIIRGNNNKFTRDAGNTVTGNFNREFE